jgi:hypothetical protein
MYGLDDPQDLATASEAPIDSATLAQPLLDNVSDQPTTY